MAGKIQSAVWIWGLLIILGVTASCQKEVGAGSQAPDFQLMGLNGDAITLEQHRGNVVLLDFWATWCPPCRRAIPELVEMQKKYGDDGLVILGVSMDDPRLANEEYMYAFKEKMNINYPILWASQEVVQAYFPDGRTAIPTLYVIDREGKIREKVVGYRPGAVERAVVELLQ